MMGMLVFDDALLVVWVVDIIEWGLFEVCLFL